MLKTVPEQGQERLKDGITLGRFGEPEDVGHLAVVVASDETSYIAGQTINCDGGSFMS
jgi:NAD(P)-dependent dehydrogenase (short-subunit alcohol dehydrogenase family)